MWWITLSVLKKCTIHELKIKVDLCSDYKRLLSWLDSRKLYVMSYAITNKPSEAYVESENLNKVIRENMEEILND